MPGLTPMSLGIDLSLTGIGGGTNTDTTNDLLLETGDFLLLETGDKLLLESN